MTHGAKIEGGNEEFVVFEGSPLDIDGRVRAVRNAAGEIDVWIWI